MNPVEHLWELFDRRDYEATAPLLHSDFMMNWPQSRERIRGAANFIAINRHYPGIWRTRLKELIVDRSGQTIAAEVTVSDETVSVTCIGFYCLKDGLIWRGTEYWPEPYPAPTWRAQWVEPYDSYDR